MILDYVIHNVIHNVIHCTNAILILILKRINHVLLQFYTSQFCVSHINIRNDSITCSTV